MADQATQPTAPVTDPAADAAAARVAALAAVSNAPDLGTLQDALNQLSDPSLGGHPDGAAVINAVSAALANVQAQQAQISAPAVDATANVAPSSPAIDAAAATAGVAVSAPVNPDTVARLTPIAPQAIAAARGGAGTKSVA